MIRLAEPKDIDLIYALCREAHEFSTYSHVPHNEHDARQIFGGLIVAGSAWVTDDVDGILMAYVQPLWFNHSRTAATDLIFYVRDSAVSAGVKLAKKYKKWGKENADDVYLSISFGGDISRTDKFYSRLNFERIGGSYILKGD